jgi:lambda repressor-like predicted transcriptional regulator
MHPAQIQAALKMRGTTQADVAAQCGGVSATAVYSVIHGRSRSKRIEMRIAAITGLPLAELWPAWHCPKAKRARSVLSTAQVAQALRVAVR